MTKHLDRSLVCLSVCHHGKWSCKSLPNPATCAVEEGSHVTTFDGKAYTFHGACYYTLAKVENKVNKSDCALFSARYVTLKTWSEWTEIKNMFSFILPPFVSG